MENQSPRLTSHGIYNYPTSQLATCQYSDQIIYTVYAYVSVKAVFSLSNGGGLILTARQFLSPLKWFVKIVLQINLNVLLNPLLYSAI